jgi:hypothetical protein
MVSEQCLPITSTQLLEKVFPVYALGLFDPNPDYILDGSDPIWEAIKAEAKLEVRFLHHHHCFIQNYVLSYLNYQITN